MAFMRALFAVLAALLTLVGVVAIKRGDEWGISDWKLKSKTTLLAAGVIAAPWHGITYRGRGCTAVSSGRMPVVAAGLYGMPAANALAPLRQRTKIERTHRQA